MNKEIEQEKCCGNCVHFLYEDPDGNGYCKGDAIAYCGMDACSEWEEEVLTNKSK